MIWWEGDHDNIGPDSNLDYNKWLSLVCATHGMRFGDIGVKLVGDDELLEINRSFLNHDYFTDIITFDRTYGNIVTGEVWMSRDRIIENAGILNILPQDEFDRVVVHGVLHLIGFNDATDVEKLKMRELESKALAQRNR